MIKENDLIEAIAECEGAKNPNANTCIKLAAYYTILENLYGKPQEEKAEKKHVSSPKIAFSESEFSKITSDKGIENVFPLVDDLVQTISVLNPALYNSFINQLNSL
jgi:hypothetical protein